MHNQAIYVTLSSRFVLDLTNKRISQRDQPKAIMKNIVSLISSLWVASNLIFGLLLLIPVSIISALFPFVLIRRWCFFLTQNIYRIAVQINSFWMKRIIGIGLIVKGESQIHPNAVIICNHQSWFDIPIIQDVVTSRGPMVKFLIKRELVWVPIIGWICLALRLPTLGRSKNTDTRARDRIIIQNASNSHANEPGALLIFPEGTRFTEKKRAMRGAPYNNLLKPRSGGLNLIKEHTSPDVELVDMTIDYHRKNVSIWECLHGAPSVITITLKHYKIGDIKDASSWLNERWKEKDIILTADSNGKFT